jgi:hypothetical protein
MPAFENLFAAEPTLPNIQTTKMPDDPQQWVEIVTNKLREQYPDVARFAIAVEFRKKDEQAGCAIGAIQVMNSDNTKTIYVPFIIQKFEMCPLDIWMESGSQAVHPMSPDTFKKEFFVQSMAESLDQRPADSSGQYFNDTSLWNQNYPPLQGRYSYASGGYDILDKISDVMDAADLERFKETLKKEAHLINRFKKHGHLELIQKLAKVSPYTRDFAASALKLIPQSAASIKKEGPDKYSILSFADQLFDLSEVEMFDGVRAKEKLSRIIGEPWDYLHDVDVEGEKIVLHPEAPKNTVFLFSDMKDKPENADKFGIYTTKTKQGIELTGLVIPYVVNFKGQKQHDKLFISHSHSTFQGSIAGVRQPESDAFKKLLIPGGARVGQTGTFVFVDDGKAIATLPVTITAIEKYGPMNAVLLDGTKIKISRGFSDRPSMGGSKPATGKKDPNFLDCHGMIETAPKEYTIPQSMFWLPMEGFQEITATPAEWFAKEASHRAGLDPLVIRWTGIVYEAAGSGIDKVAYDERRMKLHLAGRGVAIEKIAGIMKEAKAVGRVKVHGLPSGVKKASIIKEANDAQRAVETLCSHIKCNLIKEAAELEDNVTVDALLSLNFINPDNVARFASYRPVFEKVLDYLAELVLATRLGLKASSEGALVTSISRLQEVVEGIKKLESSIKHPTTKTAAAKKPAKKADHKAEKPQLDEKKMTKLPETKGKASKQSGNPFADGLFDAEAALPLHMSKWKNSAKSMYDYMRGKRMAEENKAMSMMALGVPPKGSPKPKVPGATGAKK